MDKDLDGEVQLPDDALTAAAGSAFRELAESETQAHDAKVFVEMDGRRIEMPRQALVLLRAALEHLAQGHAVTVTPYLEEVTPRQAAELLGVSRPYVMKLLHQGALGHRRVGAHHRIPLKQVIAHRATMQQDTAQALDALADLDRAADDRGQTIPGYDD